MRFRVPARGTPTKHEICQNLICEDLRDLWFIPDHPHSLIVIVLPPLLGELEGAVSVSSVKIPNYCGGNKFSARRRQIFNVVVAILLPMMSIIAVSHRVKFAYAA